MIAQALDPSATVLSVDVDHRNLEPRATSHPGIEFLESSSVAPEVAERIRLLRSAHPGPAFFILDSDHSCAHVLAELKAIRGELQPGDYVIVEDSNINGHPVSRNWGPGPFEAVLQYESEYPGDYDHDQEREQKFGFTFATRGFLVFRGEKRDARA